MGKVPHIDAVYPPVGIARHTDDHEFQWRAAGIFKGMHFAQLDRDRIAGLDLGNFGTAALGGNRYGALSTHDVIEFGDFPVQVGSVEVPGGSTRWST